MRLGIDASNIRSGGGITHLTETLRAADPSAYGFEKVVIWASAATLSVLKNRSWLIKRTESALESNSIRRVWWQRMRLGKLANAEGCDLLFVPGGTVVTDFRPVVTMSQNLLPFQWLELLRYRRSVIGIRLLLLRWTQSISFRKANGVVFLTDYAREVVTNVTGSLTGETCVVPHGLDACFFQHNLCSRTKVQYSETNPYRIIYVSIIDLYKHQWHVAKAVAMLRNEGWPVFLSLIGPANPSALSRLKKTIARLDAKNEFLRYLGPVPHNELPSRYAAADLCVFASSCENMPNILLEGMASGLPIACSDRGPMPEILGDAGVYFDPESPVSIAEALRQLLESSELCRQKTEVAYQRAQQYSWARCANETFAFLAEIAAKRI